MTDPFIPSPFSSEAAMDRAIDAFAVWDEEEGMVTMVRASFDQLVVTARSAFRRTRVLCGHCGCWYNAPEQEHEHGIGKCGIMPGGRPDDRHTPKKQHHELQDNPNQEQGK